MRRGVGASGRRVLSRRSSNVVLIISRVKQTKKKEFTWGYPCCCCPAPVSIIVRLVEVAWDVRCCRCCSKGA